MPINENPDFLVVDAPHPGVPRPNSFLREGVRGKSAAGPAYPGVPGPPPDLQVDQAPMPTDCIAGITLSPISPTASLATSGNCSIDMPVALAPSWRKR